MDEKSEQKEWTKSVQQMVKFPDIYSLVYAKLPKPWILQFPLCNMIVLSLDL